MCEVCACVHVCVCALVCVCVCVPICVYGEHMYAVRSRLTFHCWSCVHIYSGQEITSLTPVGTTVHGGDTANGYCALLCGVVQGFLAHKSGVQEFIVQIPSDG